MKKVKLLLTMAVIVFATMICCSMSAFALTDGDWEFQLIDNEVTITKYIGEGGDVIVPEMIYGCPVTNIGYKFGGSAATWNAGEVFKGKNIKSIDLQAKVTEVPSYFAFENASIETVTLPNTIETIAESSFWHCTNLKKINIPSSVKKIGRKAFYECSSLTSIILPEGIEEIGGEAFYGTGLTEIDLRNVKVSYGDGILSRCHNLKSVKLSANVENIPGSAFYECTSLTDVEIPNGVTAINDNAFYGCTSLENIILPTTLKSIGNDAFWRVPLTEIVIPYGTETIYGTFTAPFGEIESLEAVYIPDTVNTIYMGIFRDCPNVIVYCSPDSYVAKYCKENSISYLTDNSVNSGIHVYYNGKRISFHSYSQNPEILEGRTLVPLRSIFEAMGADVEWDGATNTAIAKRGNVEVKITIGANEIYKNGKAIPVDVPAMLLNSRTMVPARVIAEAFGADVQWNGNGRIVLITE